MKLIFLILCLLWGFVRDSYSEDIVRLLDTSSWSSRQSYYGIMQIRYNNTWATVLDYDKMKPEIMLNAYVVCRSLSYVKAEKVEKAYTVDYDPRGANKTQWPRRLRCSGREDTIKDCYNFSNVDFDNPPSKAVYVECGILSETEKSLHAQLVNFYQKYIFEPENLQPYGIVELRYKPIWIYYWTRICVANSLYGWQWDRRDANVVCKMLGYKRAIQEFIFKIPKSEYSDQSRMYHCTGKEATLAYCAQTFRRNKCKKEDDYYAGVFCEENTILPPVSYRVYSTNQPNDGYLEVRYRGAWGTACSELDRTSSDFVCRESGYLGSYEPTSSYPRPRQDPPMTEVSWELNKACNISSGNCSQGDMWKVQRYSPCERPFKVTCKVANIPKYDVISGCPPRLIINRKGLTEKEKKLITYYQVVLGGNRYFGPRWSVFYIPGNTTTLFLGDGKKYVKGLNKPLETGKTYYVYVTAVYEKKYYWPYKERFGYGDYVKYGLNLTVTDCPTSPAPTNMTVVSSTSHSEQPTHNSALTGDKLNAGHIAVIVIGMLLFIVIVVIIIFVYKKRNNQDHQQRPEHVMLHPVPEDQKA